MNKYYEALELCLKEIEQGADIETALFQYPELAAELRPILEASAKARGMAVSAPSQEAIVRNRAKLLQYASEMREEKGMLVSRRIWSVPLRRALVTLMVVTMLFASGTGLVRASSNTLPGDNLYPVKRTWEDVLLFFTFNASDREALELEHESERLDELHELFAEGRSAEVDFAGYVSRQTGTEWRISGITVILLPETRLPEQVTVGDAVRVQGRIQGGSVVAMWIELLPAGSRLPEVEDNELDVNEKDEHEDASRSVVEATAIPSENEAPVINVKATPVVEFEPENLTVEGDITSVENNFIVVDDTVLDIKFAEVEGTLSVGAAVKVEGYYDPAGIFIVTKIEFKGEGVNVGETNNNTSNTKGNDNTNDDDHSDDDGGDESNDNGNDH